MINKILIYVPLQTFFAVRRRELARPETHAFDKQSCFLQSLSVINLQNNDEDRTEFLTRKFIGWRNVCRPTSNFFLKNANNS